MTARGRSREIAFYDLETTIPEKDGDPVDILEFGAIVLDQDGLYERESFSTLLRSDRITQRSMDCNGITPEMVADAPDFSDVADRIFDTLNGRIWAGHNIKRFDNPHVAEHFRRLGRPGPEPSHLIDTLPLLRDTFGRRAGSMGLAKLGQYFGLGMERHRSIEDVRMNIEVLKACAMTIFLEENAGLAAVAEGETKDWQLTAEFRTQIEAAMEAGQEVWISYDGGTNPLIARSIRPLDWVDGKRLVRGLCMQSQTAKHFALVKVRRVEAARWDEA